VKERSSGKKRILLEKKDPLERKGSSWKRRIPLKEKHPFDKDPCEGII
jgi:hypothetical protein